MNIPGSTKVLFFVLSLIGVTGFGVKANNSAGTVSLNGTWEMGHGRNYTRTVIVPGIHTDPAMMDPETLWYRKEIELPAGNWKYATLELKGARFSPEVYINGVSVSRQNGGMAPTFHLLNHKDVKPGRKIKIEIALKSLKDLPVTDASYIPVADQWRSNISSSLWNDVVLKLHGDLRIDRVIPFIDFKNQKADFSVYISEIGILKKKSAKSRVEILDKSGRRLLSN
ncbi:MAG: glycoside hydrolase, partial [Bacteroidales bacterium]